MIYNILFHQGFYTERFGDDLQMIKDSNTVERQNQDPEKVSYCAWRSWFSTRLTGIIIVQFSKVCVVL